MYNRATPCYSHTPAKTPPLRGRKDAAVEFHGEGEPCGCTASSWVPPGIPSAVLAGPSEIVAASGSPRPGGGDPSRALPHGRERPTGRRARGAIGPSSARNGTSLS